jgi:cation:H+ antiporter
MSLLWSIFLVVLGLAVLTRSADAFVDGAVALSDRLHVSPVLIGAVVIGLGTSVPELLVSVLAAADGNAALGVGNVVGSNIANLSLVLGVAALIAPIVLGHGTIWREAPMSFAAVALFGLVLRDGLSVGDGIVLLAGLVVFGVLIVVTASRERAATGRPTIELGDLDASGIVQLRHAPTHRIGLVTALGLGGTALGAQLLITGALRVADAAGLSEGFVGVSLVAVGTSLPELVTSVQAARRREHELIVGNVLGSNIFNSLAVGGAIALFGPGDIGDPGLTGFATAVMVGVSAVTWLMMWIGSRISRFEATLLLLGYVATMVVLG